MSYKLEIDKDQLQIISDALSAMPYGRVFRLVAALQRQVNEQENGSANAANGGDATQPARSSPL